MTESPTLIEALRKWDRAQEDAEELERQVARLEVEYGKALSATSSVRLSLPDGAVERRLRGALLLVVAEWDRALPIECSVPFKDAVTYARAALRDVDAGVVQDAKRPDEMPQVETLDGKGGGRER